MATIETVNADMLKAGQAFGTGNTLAIATLRAAIKVTDKPQATIDTLRRVFFAGAYMKSLNLNERTASVIVDLKPFNKRKAQTDARRTEAAQQLFVTYTKQWSRIRFAAGCAPARSDAGKTKAGAGKVAAVAPASGGIVDLIVPQCVNVTEVLEHARALAAFALRLQKENAKAFDGDVGSALLGALTDFIAGVNEAKELADLDADVEADVAAEPIAA